MLTCATEQYDPIIPIFICTQLTNLNIFMRACIVMLFALNAFSIQGQASMQPKCNNEDFEAASSTASITSQSQIGGWMVTAGSHTSQPGSNSCNLSGCCTMNPVESAIFSEPSGYIDPLIGSCYPVFSVFGTALSHSNAGTYNPQISDGLWGNSFIRIGGPTPNSGIEKISKTFSVTPQNALFTYAFISVLQTAHNCCDGASFRVTVNGLSCYTYSTSNIGNLCSFTDLQLLSGGTNCAPATSTSAVSFNKWQLRSLDLTAYTGQTVTVEVTASDCNAGDHAGYAYFDAQCSEFFISSGSTRHSASTPSVNISNCPPASLCAPQGMGPFKWIGPGLAAGYSAFSMTNICTPPLKFASNYTVIMAPPSICFPVSRTVSYTPYPAPVVTSTAPFSLCNTTTIAIYPSLGGDSSNIAFMWNSPPNATVSGSNSPTLTTTSAGVYTVTAYNIATMCTSIAQVTVGICLDIQDEKNVEFHTFPNPFSGSFDLIMKEGPNCSISIYDFSGKLIIKKELSPGSNRIDLSERPDGIYLLRFNNRPDRAIKVLQSK
jgi:hypothetical protein